MVYSTTTRDDFSGAIGVGIDFDSVHPLCVLDPLSAFVPALELHHHWVDKCYL
jgi:hypothetical protein